MQMTRLLAPCVALFTALALTACGGGGSASNTSSSNTQAAPSTPQVANVQTVTVGPNPFGAVNSPMASVTVCVAGTSVCQTIDNVLVDTGSYGLRLQASALAIGTQLAAETAQGGGQLTECLQFGSGYTWGSVRTADVKIGGETASNMPIQLVGDSVGSAPGSCSATLASMNTPALMLANGILGVGNRAEDCASCAVSAINSQYYSCTSSSSPCTQVIAATTAQVVNPVARFPVDNNGVVLTFPSVPMTAAQVDGTMTFGIGTASNNTLGSAQVMTTQPYLGFSDTLNATFNSTPYHAIVDSGSNSYLLPNTGYPTCGGANNWLCPATPQSLSVSVQGVTGPSAPVALQVVSEATLALTGNWAQNSLAADSSHLANLVDLGLPFFFGRTVYTAIAGKTAPGGTTPYVAF